ncbi:hypothetical protein HSX10_13300 [Winogradskyella undariae]|nr:hypothetical protein [Winogradskyella undariae]
MKYWMTIEERLKNNIALALQLLLLLVGVYIIIMAEEFRIWKIPLLIIGLLSWFFFGNKTKYPIIWIMLFMILIVDLCNLYFGVANHHFMLLYMVLSVLLYFYHKRTEILQKNIQMLLVVVVITSVVQKLMSSQFINGDFYYDMMNKGGLFRVFFRFFPEKFELIKSNYQSFLDLNNTNPNLYKKIELKTIIPHQASVSLVFAWVTIFVEFLVALFILVKPKNTWTHLLFAMMILGVLCTRLETGFMALLSICGLLLCHNLKLRLLYVLMVVGCITLVVTKFGFH